MFKDLGPISELEVMVARRQREIAVLTALSHSKQVMAVIRRG